MPSPLGHALAGAAAGWVVSNVRRAGPDGRSWNVWRAGMLFALAAMLPDIDLLVGVHRGPTHGLGSAVIAGLAAAALTRGRHLALGASAAYASHTLLDWLGSDTSAPLGIMALWPFSSEYYKSEIHVFSAISRRYWAPGFVTQNVRAISRELLILLPIVLLSLWWSRRSRIPHR